MGGDPTPSPEDLGTTAQILRAGELLALPLVDHVIVTRDPLRYHSMLERGMLQQV
jgi:DNA repair protein RadC